MNRGAAVALTLRIRDRKQKSVGMGFSWGHCTYLWASSASFVGTCVCWSRRRQTAN